MSSLVKVTNMTNTDSAVLKQFRLGNHSLEVCGQMVDPGKSVTLPREDWLLATRSYDRLVKLGALKVEDVEEKPEEAAPALVKMKKAEKSE